VPQNKPEPRHFGSRLLWLPDGSLLVVRSADCGNPPLQLEGCADPPPGPEPQQCPGQAACASPGMEPQPVGNPFCPPARAKRPKVWSYGHRNVQGLALDPLQRAGLGEANTAGPRRR